MKLLSSTQPLSLLSRLARQALLCGVLLCGLAVTSAAQVPESTRPRRAAQTGLALVPGAGLQVGYVATRTLFTVESIVYADGAPQFAGGEGTLQLSLGLGGAVRPLGFPRLIGTADYPYDFDIGLRFGPSLTFTQGATQAEKNQQFSLFIEPFLRFSSQLSGGRFYFVEAGTQRPLFRGGLFFAF